MAGIKIGSAAMIEIGYAGENRTREIIFDAKEWMERLPGCEPAIVGVRADGVEFTAPDVRKDEEEKTIIWTLTAGETIAGEGEAQLLWMDGEKVAKKAIMVTMCRESLETEATVQDAPEPTWGQQAIDAMQRAQAAASKAETALGAVNGAKNEAIAAIEEADVAVLEGIAYAKDRAIDEIDAAAGKAATAAEDAARRAEEAADRAEDAADRAEAAGGGEGGHDKDGFSPIVDLEETENGVTVSVTDAEGTEHAFIRNGVSIEDITIAEYGGDGGNLNVDENGDATISVVAFAVDESGNAVI